MKRMFFALLALIGVLGFSSLSYGDELAEIQKSIVQKGVRWQAGETSISALPEAERVNRLGDLEPVLTGSEKVIPKVKSQDTAPLPTTFDWRNNGGNFVTPVRNQGNCGSCWAFSAVGGLESNVLIARNTPGVNLNLSEQVLVSCNDNSSGSCSGGYKTLASDYLRDVGVPMEKCYKYTQTDGTCSKACADWQNCTYKLGSWSLVTKTVEDMKAALYTYGPLPVSMYVYRDFYYYKGGVYQYSWGSYEGGHAILLVGYDDDDQCFIVKNSWGKNWGIGGYFKIAYTELDTVVGFGRDPLAYTPTPVLTVTTDGDGKGTVTANCLACKKGTCSGSYSSGTEVTVTAQPKGKTVFNGWSGCTSVSGDECTVAVTSDVTVTATFLKPPKIVVTPGAVGFGGIAVEDSSDPVTLSIRNAGTADLVISSTVITGTNAADFSVSGDCGTVSSDDTCTDVQVTFTPTSTGRKKAFLDLYSNAPTPAKKRLVLTGKGIAAEE